MKSFFHYSCALAATLLFSLSSCVSPGKDAAESATLRLNFDPGTRSAQSFPDLSEYILSISGSDGMSVIRAPWGECPSEFVLDADSYDVAILSSEFDAPCYACPQFGDSRNITLAEGQVAELDLVAAQMNAGIRLIFSESFVANYKEGSVFLRSSQGTLAFGFSETRTAFFNPGSVSLLLNYKGKTSVIHTLTLQAGEMMCLKLSVSETMPKAIPVSMIDFHIRVDTSRIWSECTVAWDGTSSGGGTTVDVPDQVYSVAEARGMAGKKDIWVSGYIVGGDLSSKSCSFAGPFSARTNMVIADAASCTDRDRCMSVQLSQGDIRNALNLVDNPSKLGKKVCLRGDVVESYYRLPGIQNLSDYRF
ncbi:MAG: DUF6359 domain-containing protein [Bacteroidales bacterium]|nr:DUF6359 domain-containing protein [Bacteroidales bacterium]